MSLDIGCVRLTERFLRGDPPTAAEVAAAVRPSRPNWIGPRGDPACWRTRARPGRRLVGLAGTVSTLASLELGLAEYDRERIHHAVLTAEAVGAVVRRPRRRTGGASGPGGRACPPGAEDVIFGGALVLAGGDEPVRPARMHRLGVRHPRRSHPVHATPAEAARARRGGETL